MISLADTIPDIPIWLRLLLALIHHPIPTSSPTVAPSPSPGPTTTTTTTTTTTATS